MTKKKKNRKLKKKEKNISLDTFEISPYQEVINKIDKRVGKTPPLPSDLEKGQWSEQSLKVLKERYLRIGEDGKVSETPERMCWRVAWRVASAEVIWGKKKREVISLARQFYEMLVRREFLPNSPTLMNAGVANSLQYSGCFVLPVEDSLVGIFDAIKYQALIHQTGGGTGFSFSRLRPKGSIVKSSRGVASGPVSFMRVFDAATNEIKQGGKRRGANMGILRVDHPDILEFIHCKELGGITNFNISVGLTDSFMDAYKKGKKYDLVDPKTGKKTTSYDAREVFGEIAKSAWKTGDPGIIFLDRLNSGSSNPVPVLGPIESTNPCGEQPLYPYDSCNLGSIFLTYFVSKEKGKYSVDWQKLENRVRLGVRFLDDVIDVNPYPLEEIRKRSLAIRRIGLGIGGWADMLIELGIAYDSEEALKLAEKIIKYVDSVALDETQKLALEREPFYLWPVSIYKNDKPRRNSTTTTIAPTGSISIIAGASSGIEPLFAIAYRHVVKDKQLDRTLTFINPKFESLAQKNGLWKDGLKEKISKYGVVRSIDEIPGDIKKIFGTAQEIDYIWHIKHQAVFQKYTENAVSKTINLAKSATTQDIKKAYLLAWKMGCKGVTVFRDGCKDRQVINLGTEASQEGGKTKNIHPENGLEPLIERPLVVRGATYRLKTPVGTAFITINENEIKEPLEVFITIGKTGSDIAAMADALARTISTALRFKGNLPPIERAKEVAHQLAGIAGRRSVGFGANKILSLPDAVAAALSWHFGFKVNGFLKNNYSDFTTSKDSKLSGYTNGRTNSKNQEKEEFENVPNLLNPNNSASKNPYLDQSIAFKSVADICPTCGASALVYEEGCSKCQVCGYSEC